MRRCLILVSLLALFAAPADADDVFLKGGGKVTGRILSRTATSLEMDIGAAGRGLLRVAAFVLDNPRRRLDELEMRVGNGRGDGCRDESDHKQT